MLVLQLFTILLTSILGIAPYENSRYENKKSINSDTSYLKRSIVTKDAIIGIDYSPNGRYLVSGGAAKTVDIWNATTGKLIKSMEGHTDDILAVAYSPAGTIVASGGVDKKIIVWSTVTKDEVFTLEGHDDYVRDLVFSPDGKLLASASWDQTAIIWDVSTGKRLQTLSGHQDNVTSVDFNEDGTQLVTACGDHQLRVWNIETGELLKVLKGHTDEIWDVKWSNNSRFIASGGWDNKARVWDYRTGEEQFNFPGHVTDVWSVSFDPKGLILATSGGDKTVKLWDLATGNLILNISKDVHVSDVEEVRFSPDGKFLASASRDGKICFWNVPNLEERIAILAQQAVDEWSVKQPFEKTAKYEKRMKEKENYRGEIEAGVVDKVLRYFEANVEWDKNFELGEYDADQEYFVLNTPTLGRLRLMASNNQAPAILDNFDRLVFKDLNLRYNRGYIYVDTMTAIIKGLNRRYSVTQ